MKCQSESLLQFTITVSDKTAIAVLQNSCKILLTDMTGLTYLKMYMKLNLILEIEERWFDREFRESIWETVEQPTTNNKGGLRFQLSHAWDPAIQYLPHRLAQEN